MYVYDMYAEEGSFRVSYAVTFLCHDTVQYVFSNVNMLCCPV